MQLWNPQSKTHGRPSTAWVQELSGSLPGFVGSILTRIWWTAFHEHLMEWRFKDLFGCTFDFYQVSFTPNLFVLSTAEPINSWHTVCQFHQAAPSAIRALLEHSPPIRQFRRHWANMCTKVKALGVLKMLHRKSTTWSPYGLPPPAPCPACPLVIRSSGAHTVWSTKTKKCLKQTKHNHAKWCETETKNIGDIGVDGSKSKTSTTLGLDLSSTQNSLKSAAVLPKTKVSACDNSIPGTWHHFLESRESCNNHSTIYTYQQARLVKLCLHKTHPLALSVAFYMNHTALTPDPTHPKSPWASQVVCKSWALVSPSPFTPTTSSLLTQAPQFFQEAPSFPQHLGRIGGTKLMVSSFHLVSQLDWNFVKQPNTSNSEAVPCARNSCFNDLPFTKVDWRPSSPDKKCFLTQELAQPEVICLLFKKSSNLLRVDLAESLQVTGCIDGALIHLLLSVVLS